MTWYPIAYLPPQIENSSGAPYSGGVLKAYADGTNTNIPMATDYTGVTTAASMLLNASGYPTQGGAVVIPHLQENYKLALYPTQTAADANSGAVWTIDNIQIAEDTNSAFIQYFDGDGVTATFTLSQSFGTDENILMVFADRTAPAYQANGDFASDTIWSKGAGWTIAAGVATATGAISTAISQTATSPIVAGQAYEVEFTITASAGALVPSVGGTSGTSRNSSGTYKEIIIAGSTQTLAFTGAAFTGTLDSVVIRDVATQRRIINRPDEYTLSANQLTLNNVPPSGTKNVVVFAPSQLLGAANNAAAAAATSETNAAASAATASAAATSASASYDSFDDRYLGSKAADPTLDNDGNALLEGALYWNNVSKVMRVYNGTAWTAAYVGAGGFLQVSSNLSDVSSAATSRSNLGAAASGANSDITSLSGITSINAGQIGGFRNALINGAFQVWQRGSTYTLASAAAYGSADRWATQGPNSAGIFNRDTTAIGSALGFQYNAKLGRNNGSSSTTGVVLAHVLETANSLPLAGKSVTLSFYAKAGADFSSASSNILVQLVTGTGTDQTVQNLINGAWTGSANAISAVQALTTTLTRYQFTATLPVGATQVGVVMSYTPVGTAGADDNIYITGVQLEPGPVATPFEFRNFAAELALCQRYYEKTFPYATAPAQSAGQPGSQNCSQTVGASTAMTATGIGTMKVTKRAAPTITTYNPSAANAQARNFSASTDCSAIAVGGIGDATFALGVTTPGGSAAGNQIAVHWTADAEL